MKQKRLLLFIGITFAAVGLTFLGLCIFQNGNQLFLNQGKWEIISNPNFIGNPSTVGWQLRDFLPKKLTKIG